MEELSLLATSLRPQTVNLMDLYVQYLLCHCVKWADDGSFGAIKGAVVLM